MGPISWLLWRSGRCSPSNCSAGATPGTGAVRFGTGPDDLNAWMIDTNHDGLISRPDSSTARPDSPTTAVSKPLAESLGRGRRYPKLKTPSGRSYPSHSAPDPGKAITKTGTEIAGLITAGW